MISGLSQTKIGYRFLLTTGSSHLKLISQKEFVLFLIVLDQNIFEMQLIYLWLEQHVEFYLYPLISTQWNIVTKFFSSSI